MLQMGAQHKKWTGFSLTECTVKIMDRANWGTTAQIFPEFWAHDDDLRDITLKLFKKAQATLGRQKKSDRSMSGSHGKNISSHNLLSDVHACLPCQPEDALCRGHYFYYHYGCDEIDDRGWGCGYRTLQTLCSWVRDHHLSSSATSPPPKTSPVPGLIEIQRALFEMGDKPKSFIRSKQWIGSVEACFILDHFYDVPCKMVHVEKGSDIGQILPELYEHFQRVGTPVMMGGEMDNSSKGIMGVRHKDPALLVVDPHYFGERPTFQALQSKGYVKWLPIDELHVSSFYNLCLPKVPSG